MTSPITMKSIDDIRRENLALLRKEVGSSRGLAARLDRDESQVGQWMHGALNSGTGKPRGMRSDTARYIEKCMGKPDGWMDAARLVSTPIGNTRRTTMDVRVIERLREAAKDHGEVADLLDVLADCFPFLQDGDSEFKGDDQDREYLKSAVAAAAFAQFDRDNN